MENEEIKKTEDAAIETKGNAAKKDKEWQTPTLEDVSEKIMAQPYIRFT